MSEQKIVRYRLFSLKTRQMTKEEKEQVCAILIKWGYSVRLVEVETTGKKNETVVEYWREN